MELSLFKRILNILKNRYVLTGLAFLVWMVFIDRDDWFSGRILDQKLTEAAKERDYYQKAIQRIDSNLYNLKSKPQALEKFARETYYMKKDNEDLYVMVMAKQKDTVKPTLFNKIRSIFSKPIPLSSK